MIDGLSYTWELVGTAGVPELIDKLLPLVLDPETRMEIDGAGGVMLGKTLCLGSLTVEPDDEIREALDGLWAEFAAEVSAQVRGGGR